MTRTPAYYQPLYPYYVGRRVTAFRLYRMLGGVVLDELGEVRDVVVDPIMFGRRGVLKSGARGTGHGLGLAWAS